MKTKLYAKKTLSVFMAVMMLMTCWVFVAPEKAEAVSADVAPATTYATYNVKLTAEFKNIGQSGHIIIYYYPVNADGSLNTSVRGEYLLVNSASKYSSTTWTFDTADNNTRRLASGQDEGAETGPIQGWPCGVKLQSAGSIISSSTIALKSMYINGVQVVKDGTWSAASRNTKEVFYTYKNDSGYVGYLNDWNVPAVSSVRTQPAAQTISVPKGSTASKTFTVAYNDQYGVQWPGTSGTTVTLSPAPSGATVTLSGNTATVSANETVFANLSNYNTSTGKGTATLNMVNNGVTASTTVTFQAPQYNLKFVNNAGTAVYNQNHYYRTTIDCASIASGLANTIVNTNSESGHNVYVWDSNKYVNMLTSDVVVNEVLDKTVAHNYSDWTQGDTAHTRTCTVCGYVHTQDHISDIGYVTKAETCTEDGVMTYDCAVCGKKAIATSVINNINGHDFSGEIVENVTGENGNHWRKCSRCDVYGWAGVVDACENHNWDKNNDKTVNSLDAVESKASTCKEAGYETYQCKVCNATFTKELPLAAHTVKKTAAKDVTNICGGDGNVEFWSCSVCNRVWKDEALTDEVADLTDVDNDNIPDVLETKGPEHNFNGAYVSISGGADGKHHRQCERFTQCQTYGPEEAHNYGEPVVTPATCTATGKEVYTCADCKQSYTVTLEKIPHTLTKIEAVEPVCGKAGNNEYYQCEVCKAYFKDAAGTIATTVAAETLPALVHTWTAHHDYDTPVSAATCQSKAVYNNHCDYCKVQMVGATHEYGEVDLVNGHKFDGAIKDNGDKTHSYKCTVEGCTAYSAPVECEYEITKETDSTCKTAGYITYECTVCKNGYSVEKALDPNNHEGEGTKLVGAKDAMCNTDGYTGDTHCLGCDTELKKGEAIKADPAVHPHENMKDYDGKEATCQTEGYKAYRYCDQCGTYAVEKETIAKKDHKFTTYTSNGDGTHTALCDTCDAAVADKATDKKDCTGGTANCVDLKVCEVCEEPYGEVDEENHKTIITVSKVEPTCQTEGTIAYRKCEACGVNIDEPEKIEKLQHVWGSWEKVEGEDKHTRACTTCKDTDELDIATETAACSGGAANCVDKAKCEVCKAEYGATNPAVHKTEANTLKDVVAATCTAPGYTGNYHYNCCDAIKEYGEETAKLEHSYTIEVEGSRVDATCIAAGKVTYKCSTCPEDAEAATKDEVLPIDSKNHASDKEITVGAYPATCTTEGFTGNVYHACCYNPEEGADNSKALIKKGEKIKANGQHILGAGVPEYMLELDENGEAIIVEEKDNEGNVISKTLKLKAEEPDYDGKVAERHDDGKWYHAQICDECGLVVYTACYTYEHTYNCVETDICEICSGLCSLTDSNKHKAALVLVEGTAATCIAEGVKDYYNCADCGKNYLDAAGKTIIDITIDKDEDGIADVLEIAKTAHSIDWANGEVVKEPTCGVNGETKYSCKVEGCTYTVTRADIPSDGVHEWNTEYTRVDEPTCCKNGYEAILCSVCESVKPNSYVTIPATGEHNYDKDKDGDVDKDDAVVTPGENCQKPGTLTYTCQNEGCTNTKIEIDESGISAHQWSDWVTVGGDCSSGVVQERECTVCHIKEQQTITTDTHNLTVKIRVEPTPEKDGYVIYECKNCGYVSEPEVLKYEGAETEEHLINEEEYTIVKQATCVNGEIRAYICLRCGEKVEKEIGEPLEHVWLEQAEEKATCAKDGHSAYYRCVRCLAEYGEGKVIYPATGHVDNDGDGKCDSCNSAFYEDGDGSKTCGCICHKEGWFMQLIYKIVRFFWKLFRIGHSCDCGAVHY